MYVSNPGFNFRTAKTEMIAYQNRLLFLTIIEDEGILVVTWTDSVPYDAAELQASIDKVIETINKFEIRKLLIDASEATMAMDDETIRIALVGFAKQLGKTGVKKLARVITSDQTRETRVQSIREEVSLPFEIYDISNREQALKWLTQDS